MTTTAVLVETNEQGVSPLTAPRASRGDAGRGTVVDVGVMFRIRQSYREDVDQVLAVAEHLDTVNLPADRGHIEKILELSEKSFAEAVAIPEREFLFVLEDLSTKRIIGTSMIYAQHGTKRAPHIFYRVENDERYSVTLDRHFVHPLLVAAFAD